MELTNIEQPHIQGKISRGQIIQIVFLALLFISLCTIIWVTGTIYKYHDMLLNPIGYNLAHWNISSCTYFQNGQTILINATKP
jgi:hypothetical protein